MRESHFTHLTLGNILRGLSIIGFVMLLVVYVQFQARSFLEGPAIILNDEYMPVQHTRTLTLTGKVENIVKLTLNGKEIHTDKDGVFTEELRLEQGYTIVSLNAQDRFGRQTSIVREYVYVPPS